PEEALHAFGKALELNPRAIDTWSFIWDLFEEQGRYRLWHRMAEQMTALLSEEPILWFSFGIANAELGRYEAALTAYDRALKIDPDLDKKGTPADLHRTVVLSNLGRHTAALELLESIPAPASALMQFRHGLAHADTLMWLDRWEEGRTQLDDVLHRFAPGLWDDVDFAGITQLIAGTQNPAIWRRFISVWLELFARHERLTQLGRSLVWGIRVLTLPWISDAVARSWYDTWRELAGGLEEMTLPLRLLKAGVDYKATRDPQVLLALAQEERRLLEPWLINLFREEPDEIDREMENLLHVVKQRLTQAAETELMPRAATTNAADPPVADA
ncbi:MAG TPA: tetratricopeptide repeat protein, partial [Candidatus Competibacter phosphatis]|nr:tetratricopeptide repeat protein [Candidatus Competibacter phosphatis]